MSLVVLSAMAVAVSVLTPMLLGAVGRVVFSETVAGASPTSAGVVAVAQTAGSDTVASAQQAVATSMAALQTPGAWGPVGTVTATTIAGHWRYVNGGEDTENGFVSLVPTACAGLTLVAGACPADAGEVLVSESDQRRLHLRLRGVIQLDFFQRANPPTLTIVGVYDAGRGAGRVLSAPGSLVDDEVVQPVDALLVGASGTNRFIGYPLQTYAARALRTPAHLGDVAAIRRDVAAASASTLDSSGAVAGAQIVTGIPTLIAQFDADQQAASLLTAGVALQAVLLAWFALASVIQRISRVRAPEWGIGRTRAVPRRTWLGIVLLEPAIAIVVGAAAGAALGVGLAFAVARLAIGPAATIEPFTPVVVGAALLALIGSLVALVAASVRSARLPLAALLRETTEPRESSRPALVAQTGLVLLAVFVIADIVTVGSRSPLALLAPAVIALVIALGALRAAVLVVRTRTRRPARSLMGLVVVRQLGRAPSVLTVAVIVAVGFALASYALQLALVADRLASAQAAASVGATTVLRVTVPAGSSIEHLVDVADPSGREAMAVREVQGAGVYGASRIVAVDTSRLDRVTTWRPEWRGPYPSTLIAQLAPRRTADLTLTGTRLQIVIAHVDVDKDSSTPALRIVVALPDGSWRTVSLGTLRNGPSSATIPCLRGCRVIDIGGDAPGTGPWQSSFVIASLSTDRRSSTFFEPWLHDSARWRNRVIDDDDPTLPNEATLTSTAGGLGVELADAQGGSVSSIEPDVGPETLPAIAAASADLDPFPGFFNGTDGTDLDGRPLLLTLVGHAPVLPRALGDGVLVDLGEIERLSDLSSVIADDEVWLGPGDHTAVMARLHAEGVRVLATDRLRDAIRTNQRTAPVRALQLSLVTAGVAVLLALLAVLTSRIAASSTLARDRRTLLAAGVTRRRLSDLVFVEIAAPAGLGALIGVLSGVVAYILTIAGLPIRPQGANPPPDFSPPLIALLLLAVGAAAAIAAFAAAIARSAMKGDST